MDSEKKQSLFEEQDEVVTPVEQVDITFENRVSNWKSFVENRSDFSKRFDEDLLNQPVLDTTIKDEKSETGGKYQKSKCEISSFRLNGNENKKNSFNRSDACMEREKIAIKPFWEVNKENSLSNENDEDKSAAFNISDEKSLKIDDSMPNKQIGKEDTFKSSLFFENCEESAMLHDQKKHVENTLNQRRDISNIQSEILREQIKRTSKLN